MKIILRSLMALGLLGIVACSNVKVIETHSDGGTIKFRRRGLNKDSREDKSIAQADEHCKKNGFKTYKITNESQDGRFMLLQYKCEN